MELYCIVKEEDVVARDSDEGDQFEWKDEDEEQG
jgi:hypothetical protein